MEITEVRHVRGFVTRSAQLADMEDIRIRQYNGGREYRPVLVVVQWPVPLSSDSAPRVEIIGQHILKSGSLGTQSATINVYSKQYDWWMAAVVEATRPTLDDLR